ncbi:MAPEG family protein [Gilvimarinus agarilyticus]|uniref:MAPEG family protein n=1 Tax=unclassified Gilvimarinus TaxID=2642066 RepID=UPI001C0964D9|nr:MULTISPECIES: MAPEG family protein [unclassified Gilvimarinus]MBU2885930.1 MAPEG family protein [Gilvimarinus agarilyticus]MDO6570676.1 MAPEG family protein [Gilvimarinus sp. 2_MG-2023]MDO6747731.1 MAPEG family protein [Gilvimarinus sp. 1_MG-2023]
MIYPMAAMVLLTFYVALRMFKARVNAVKSGQVSIEHFKTYATPSHELPPMMIYTQRCYNNLLEMPILFYAACLTAMTIQLTGMLMLVLAWVYVACRILQAMLHLRGKVRWRMRSFLASVVCLLAMWAVLVGSALAN